jgi:hypothetical protein
LTANAPFYTPADIRFIIFSVNTLLASEQHSLSVGGIYLFVVIGTEI